VLALTWFFFNASLSLYLQPLIFKTQFSRLIFTDGIFIFLLVIAFKIVFHDRFRVLSDIFCYFYLIMFFAAVLSLAYGAAAFGIYDSVREFRFFGYFYCFLGLSYGLGRNLREKENGQLFFICSLGASLLGNLIYIVISKYNFSGTTEYYLSQYEYSEDTIQAFRLGITQKYKMSPVLIAMAQSFAVLTIFNKRRFYYVAWIMTALCLYLALSSNMRSILLAYMVGTFLPLFVFMFQNFGRFIIGQLLLTMFFFLMYFAWVSLPYMLDLLGNTRFESQVLSRGISSADVQNRYEVLVGLATFGYGDVIGIFGNGMGAAYQQVLWSDIINPYDSGFFHLALTNGMLFMVLYILVSGVLFVKSGMYLVKLCMRKQKKWSDTFTIKICCIAGLLSGGVNHLNDSPFLSLQDAVAWGVVCGIVLSFNSMTIKGRLA
jgi:hypothetical protein